MKSHHEAPGPFLEAVAVAPYAADDAMIVFHDVGSPHVAAGLDALRDLGWATRIFHEPPNGLTSTVSLSSTMLARYTQLSATAAPSTSRINTPTPSLVQLNRERLASLVEHIAARNSPLPIFGQLGGHRSRKFGCFPSSLTLALGTLTAVMVQGHCSFSDGSFATLATEISPLSPSQSPSCGRASAATFDDEARR